MATKFLVMAAVLILSANLATGLKCYVCDSTKGQYCKSDFFSFIYKSESCFEKNNGVVDATKASCVLITGKDKDGYKYTARGCVPSSNNMSCSDLAKEVKFGEKIKIKSDSLDCYVCQGDQCNQYKNSASKFGALVALLLASLTFLF